MRSVVEVITTRAPAACSRRAMAKPIPSALPAPVITTCCPLNVAAIPDSPSRIIHRPGRPDSICLFFVFQMHGYLDRPFFCRHFQKLGIELHEGMLDGP